MGTENASVFTCGRPDPTSIAFDENYEITSALLRDGCKKKRQRINEKGNNLASLPSGKF